MKTTFRNINEKKEDLPRAKHTLGDRNFLAISLVPINLVVQHGPEWQQVLLVWDTDAIRTYFLYIIL